jgi:Uncharacterized conserved protein, COG1432
MIRVGVFCDVENVVSTFALIKQKVRFERLLNFVKEESEREGKILWKAVAFVPKKESHENLINALSFQGWRVIKKPVRTLPYGSIKANMDLDMAIEVLQTSPYLKEIVLITGDGDFVPIIDLLSKMGKRVWVIGTRKGSVAIDLIRVSDKYINITDIPEDYKVLEFYDELKHQGP